MLKTQTDPASSGIHLKNDLLTSSFFTVGNSTRTFLEFVESLRAYRIELIVDVRHIPRSHTNPQNNRDNLRSIQIDYTHL